MSLPVVRLGGAALILSLLLMGILSRRGWLDLKRMVERNGELAAKLDAGRLEKKRWERRVDRMRNDPQEQERVIRQHLGYVKPRELVIEFE